MKTMALVFQNTQQLWSLICHDLVDFKKNSYNFRYKGWNSTSERCGKRSLLYEATKTWNSTPNEARSPSTFGHNKNFMPTWCFLKSILAVPADILSFCCHVAILSNLRVCCFSFCLIPFILDCFSLCAAFFSSYARAAFI